MLSSLTNVATFFPPTGGARVIENTTLSNKKDPEVLGNGVQNTVVVFWCNVFTILGGITQWLLHQNCAFLRLSPLHAKGAPFCWTNPYQGPTFASKKPSYIFIGSRFKIAGKPFSRHLAS